MASDCLQLVLELAAERPERIDAGRRDLGFAAVPEGSYGWLILSRAYVQRLSDRHGETTVIERERIAAFRTKRTASCCFHERRRCSRSASYN